ncbi:MAG: MBL fold metallo-hydrolase [Thermoguttaceae bacterium]
MTEFLLRVNGIQAAFGFEFGLESPRANEGRAVDPYRQANVSYSLVQRRDGQVVRHTLIDCGMGIVPSLLEFEHTHGIHVVHEVLLTHPHFDHFAQLDWLSMCLLRSGRSDQPRPLPIYASPECWENGRIREAQLPEWRANLLVIAALDTPSCGRNPKREPDPKLATSIGVEVQCGKR